MSAAEADILRRARARISDPARWTQWVYARDVDGAEVDPESAEAVCWCAYGACVAVDGEAVGDEWLPVASVMGWGRMPSCINDDTDHATVLRMFDRAIELAEADQ